MAVFRYNIVNNKIKEISVNPEWNISTKETDDNTIIYCIHCGQPITFKDSMESRRYIDEHNKGYRECKDCYNNYDIINRLRDRRISK